MLLNVNIRTVSSTFHCCSPCPPCPKHFMITTQGDQYNYIGITSCIRYTNQLLGKLHPHFVNILAKSCRNEKIELKDSHEVSCSITQPCKFRLFCANKMVLGVSKAFCKNFPSHLVFKKKRVRTPKNKVFGHF